MLQTILSLPLALSLLVGGPARPNVVASLGAPGLIAARAHAPAAMKKAPKAKKPSKKAPGGKKKTVKVAKSTAKGAAGGGTRKTPGHKPGR